ncbi:DNA excision repair protein ERCC-6-like 2, partial [Dryobates pubescens]
QEQKVESMDRYLDGVQEVAYIHSNQNVVGSSKAENCLSRWAVRDVFELKQFSQLPANAAFCSAKVKRNVWEMLFECFIGWSFFSLSYSGLCQEYSVTSMTRNMIVPLYSALCQNNAFFLLDNYRRQFEEMVSHFNMRSVEELAAHIAKATSQTRQKMLKEFYMSKHPEVESFFTAEVPAQASHDCEEREFGTTCSRKRKCVVNFARSKSTPSSAKRLSSAKGLLLSRAREMQSHKRETEQLHNDSYLQDVCVDAKYKQSPTVASQAFKDFMESGLLSSKSEITEVLPVKGCERQQDLEGTQLPRKRSLSQSEHRETNSLTCKKKSFVDLLGDTSVLNDLFRKDANAPAESPRKVPSSKVEKLREKPKDFWDMLNEQNEESLTKLTDIAVIEKLCERAPHPPVTEDKEVCEGSLWIKNEKFLWKRY